LYKLNRSLNSKGFSLFLFGSKDLENGGDVFSLFLSAFYQVLNETTSHVWKSKHRVLRL
jgi:hypothetical protein